MTMLDPPPSTPSADTWLLRPARFGLAPATWLIGAILCLSIGLHVYHLGNQGDSNLYYTAAVKSMTQSWHNFFFVAAEPGGSVSVDKPPLGLWVETISALLFGVNGPAVMLPNILAGVVSVWLVYRLARPRYGAVAGLLAALALAVTPVSLAAQRNNTADGLLTLCLLLAAWSWLKAAETGRSRYIWWGAALVGLGFNIKMMQAFLPLPAFYAVYWLGAPDSMGRKIGRLTLASLLIAVLSLAWPLAVDLTPADQRPYVGSSNSNSVLELALGYNGWQRLTGLANGPGRPVVATGNAAPLPPDNFQPGARPPGNLPSLPGNNGPNIGPGQGPGGAGEVGQAGIGRFFQAPLSKELSWLLPLAVVGAAILAPGLKPAWPSADDQRSVALWGGWLLTGLIFFSIAGFFHAYYLVMLGPPLALLVGLGAARLLQWRAQGRKGAALWLLSAVGLTLAFQVWNVRQFEVAGWWLWLALGLAVVGACLWLPSGRRRARQPLGAGLLLASIMLTPLVWSYLTVRSDSPQMAVLPGAYGGSTNRVGVSPGGGPGASDRTNEALLSYLAQHTSDMPYLMAVASSMQGAPYVLATGRPVLYMGGFNGADPVVSAESLAQLIADGRLRFVLQGGAPLGPDAGQMTAINTWVAETCAPVSAVDLTGDLPSPGNLPGGALPFQPQLYDCANGSD